MTDDVAVNMHGQDISENGNNHSKIRSEHYNGQWRGVARAKEVEIIVK